METAPKPVSPTRTVSNAEPGTESECDDDDDGARAEMHDAKLSKEVRSSGRRRRRRRGEAAKAVLVLWKDGALVKDGDAVLSAGRFAIAMGESCAMRLRDGDERYR